MSGSRHGRPVARPATWRRLGLFVVAASSLGGVATGMVVAFAADTGAGDETVQSLAVAVAAWVATLAITVYATIVRTADPP